MTTFSLPKRPFPRMLPICVSLLSFAACSTESDRKLDKAKDEKRSLEQRTIELEAQRTAREVEITELQSGSQVLDQKVKELESSLAQSEAEKQKTLFELAVSEKSLLEKSKRVDELDASLKLKNSEIKSVQEELARRQARISELEVLSSSQESSINELKAQIESGNSNDFLDLNKKLLEKTLEARELRDELNSVQKEKEGLSTRLAETEAELETLNKEQQALKSDVLLQSYKGVQALIENLGPESLFSPTRWMFRKAYNDVEDCAVIFNIDRQVEVVAKENMDKMPSIRDLKLLPIRVAYQKVLVCTRDGHTQAHQEKGHIYKVNPLSNAANKSLLTARTEGSCDSQSDEVKAANMFSTPNQYIYPYAGTIDGIETIDILRPGSHGLLEYNMGSGNPDIRTSNCAAAAKSPFTTPQVKLACRLAMGEKAEEINVTMGCFTETKEDAGAKADLIFNK